MQINKKHNFDILTQFEWMDTGHNYEYRSVMHYDAFDFAISKVRVAKKSVFWLILEVLKYISTRPLGTHFGKS